MAWKQTTEKKSCKECGKTFDSKMVFGKMTTRCISCRDKRGFAYRPAVPYRYLTVSCEHGSEHYNPGGYCTVCGSGRDFS